MSLEALAAGRAAIAPYLAGDDARPVLDVGAGAGQLAYALATWVAGLVVALEPSPGIQLEAQRAHAHPHHPPGGRARVGGETEGLPRPRGRRARRRLAARRARRRGLRARHGRARRGRA